MVAAEEAVVVADADAVPVAAAVFVAADAKVPLFGSGHEDNHPAVKNLQIVVRLAVFEILLPYPETSYYDA